MPPKREQMLSVTITITRTVAELLALLDDAGGGETQPIEMRVHRVLLQLADHAQQGVYRLGAWERSWVAQAFGDQRLRERMEPGDPYGRNDEHGLRWNRRPRAGYFDGVPLTLAEAALDEAAKRRPREPEAANFDRNMLMAICKWCGAEVAPYSPEAGCFPLGPPTSEDDWKEIASKHQPGCAWVLARAFSSNNH